VVLCDDSRVTPGQACLIRLKGSSRRRAAGLGYLEAELLSPAVLATTDRLYCAPAVARRLQALVELGQSILLEGPQGCGKSTLVRHLAQLLDLRFLYTNAAHVHDPTDWMATLELRPIEGGGHQTVWVETPLRRLLLEAAENPGCRYLVHLDELSRCRDAARNGIMPALDSTRRIHDPLTSSMQPVPDNVLWVASINAGNQFAGSTPMDPGTLDRFATVRVGYPPAEAEERLLAARFPAAPKLQLHRIVEAAEALRAHTPPFALSVRATEEAASLLSHPIYASVNSLHDLLHEILPGAFCGRFEGSHDDPSTEAGQAWTVISHALGYES
jgi:nitric oxide reductase NorQ protein